jgi:hypothetical protein
VCLLFLSRNIEECHGPGQPTELHFSRDITGTPILVPPPVRARPDRRLILMRTDAVPEISYVSEISVSAEHELINVVGAGQAHGWLRHCSGGAGGEQPLSVPEPPLQKAARSFEVQELQFWCEQRRFGCVWLLTRRACGRPIRIGCLCC